MFERLPAPELVETKSTPTETTTGVSLLSLLSSPSSLDTSTVTSYSSTIMAESTVSSTSAVQTTTQATNEELMTTTSALADVATSSAAEAAPQYLTLALVIFLLILFVLGEADCFGQRRRFRRRVESVLTRVQSLVGKWEEQSDERQRMIEEEQESMELTNKIRAEMSESNNVMKEYRDTLQEQQQSILYRLDQVEVATTNVVDSMLAQEEREEARQEEKRSFQVRTRNVF